MFFNTAFAMAPPPGAEVTTMDTVMSFAPLVFLVVIFYFFLIRPQQKKQAELKDLISNLQEGDKVLTQGGLIGIIKKLKEDEITMEIAQDVKVKIHRTYIVSLVTKPV